MLMLLNMHVDQSETTEQSKMTAELIDQEFEVAVLLAAKH